MHIVIASIAGVASMSDAESQEFDGEALGPIQKWDGGLLDLACFSSTPAAVFRLARGRRIAQLFRFEAVDRNSKSV